VVVSAELLGRLMAAVAAEDHRPAFKVALFDQATFESEVELGEATFEGIAGFDHATFKRTFRNLDQGDRACASAVPGSRL
jgi:hypothetical protein